MMMMMMGNVVGDEEEKMDLPLFPRLHVTDAEEKGGPRPPPRNKMALPEQLNLPPSQKLTHGSVPSILSLSSNNANDNADANANASLVPATSSYHDESYKRCVFSPFGSSSGSTRLATRLDSYHSGGMNLNISLTTVKQTIETTNCQTVCSMGGHLKPADYCLFKPQSSTNSRTTPLKKLEDEDDYLVPNLSLGKGQHNASRGKLASENITPHLKLPSACQKQLKTTTQENKLNTTMIDNTAKEPAPYYSPEGWASEPEFSPSNPKKRGCMVDEPTMFKDPNGKLQQKHRILQENMTRRILAGPDNATKEIMSNSTWLLQGDDHKTDRSADGIVIPINRNEQYDSGSLQLGDLGKPKDISEANSVSSSNISPEEVAQLIGPEQYWKVRRTMVQQQRVFAFQIFELHRLIKVQKSLAKSPGHLFEDSFYRLKKIPPEDILPKIDSRKREHLLSFPVDNASRKTLRTNNDTDKRFTPRANCNLSSVIISPSSTASDTKQPPRCFLPPHGNQWLVPVRSPSEGLVYKPYTGPCPPPGGLVAPIYGMSLTPSNGEFLTRAQSLPTYQPGIGVFSSTPFFQPYVLPMIKPSCSPTKEENINFTLPIKTSCNILSPEILALSPSAPNLQGIIETDLQGSCGSSSSERKKGGDELPLFPTTPLVQDSNQNSEDKSSEQRIKVIKVVPHNPKVASESAARIFQSIQEERKQYD